MSELYGLPEGWEWKTLVDTATIANKTVTIADRKDYHCIGLEHIESNTGKLINFALSNGEDIKSNKVVFEKGMVLYGKLRPYLNKVWTAEFDGIATTEILPFKPINNVLDSNYLSHYLRTNYFINNAMKNISGARMPRITTKYIKNEAYIPLPPLQEQKRIVSKLDTLFEKIDKAIDLHQKNMDEADVFMGSVLNEVFGELEGKYDMSKLKDISNIISGYAFKSNDFSNKNDIKSIKITNVGVQNFVEENENYLPKDFLNNLSKYTVNYGDIVIALTRPYISNGLKVTFVPKSYNGAFINQRVAAIQASENITNNKYIYHYLCTSNILAIVMELSKTLNQPNLSIKDLSNFKIPFPPLKTQQKIVNYLDQISEKTEKVKLVQKEKMESLKALKASILDKAFRGEL